MKAPNFYQQSAVREITRDDREEKKYEEQRKLDLEMLEATKLMVENTKQRTAIAEKNSLIQRENGTNTAQLTLAIIQSLIAANQRPPGVHTAPQFAQSPGANEEK